MQVVPQRILKINITRNVLDFISQLYSVPFGQKVFLGITHPDVLTVRISNIKA